ncbi:MAG TPA: DUF3341 domain-containing protein [Solibacterales bacterium]|jgi:hypothetical protein|nr:DUF3341 domain-containing protein [Bryobacterales bacterium]
MSKNIAVFGIYASRTAAEEAVDALRNAGFRNTDISALFPDNQGSKDFAHEKSTKAPEGTATGVASGAVVGGVLGWLAGIGALAIPGIGPFIAAGPIMAALAGAGAAGVVGGLVGALVGMGIPEYEAKRYEGRVKNGGILLSVHCDTGDWVTRAKQILKDTGAEDIASTGEASADFAKSDKPMHRTSTAGTASVDYPVNTTEERVRESELSERARNRGDLGRSEIDRANDTAELNYDEAEAERVADAERRTRTSGGGNY